jgi:hypothetical protein
MDRPVSFVCRNLKLEDEDDCGQLYVFQLFASEYEHKLMDNSTPSSAKLSPKAETQVLKLFSKSEVDVASSKSVFDLAARLGKMSRRTDACRKRYFECT